jgi:hypothetical protein
LTFLSDEKIICSALDSNLNLGKNRYLPYQTMVAAAAHPTYIFPDGSPQVHSFEQAIAQKKFQTTYQRILIDGYTIYSPQIVH